MKLCCVSVDVDGVDHYHAIHGLPPAAASSAGLCHGLAISRLIQWARDMNIPLTWFVIGRDTNKAEFVRLLKPAIEAGHELANHTLDHRYDLVRLDPEAQRTQVVAAQDRLEGAFAVRAVGFRAPGYTVSDTLLDIVSQSGCVYDSSVFPCAPYYAAKALVLLLQKAVGRTSMSILDTPRVLLAPTQPYRVGQPYTRKGNGLLEIPVQVSPFGRFPFIGTALASLGPQLTGVLTKTLTHLPLVNLELHAIDFLTSADGLALLSRHQPDLRVAVSRKVAAFSTAVDVLRDAGYTFVTLLSAARGLTT